MRLSKVQFYLAVPVQVEAVDISFQAAAQAGYPARIVAFQSRVTGAHSAQEWLVTTSVWLNQYGTLLPFLLR